MTTTNANTNTLTQTHENMFGLGGEVVDWPTQLILYLYLSNANIKVTHRKAECSWEPEQIGRRSIHSFLIIILISKSFNMGKAHS